MKSNKLIEVFNLRPDKQISDKARVFDVGGGGSNDFSNTL